MEAISLDDGICLIRTERCIGCGLCVTTCTTHALSLERKAETRDVPRTNVDAILQLGRERGVLRMRDLATLMVKSKADRLLAAREIKDS
jgi:electron transport complex protein RnfB